jgi:hypothetical protein
MNKHHQLMQLVHIYRTPVNTYDSRTWSRIPKNKKLPRRWTSIIFNQLQCWKICKFLGIKSLKHLCFNQLIKAYIYIYIVPNKKTTQKPQIFRTVMYTGINIWTLSLESIKIRVHFKHGTPLQWLVLEHHLVEPPMIIQSCDVGHIQARNICKDIKAISINL